MDNFKLGFQMVPHAQLTDTGRATRMALRSAMVSRYHGRVWSGNQSFPSFYRDAQVALVPSYSKANVLQWMKLETIDASAVSTPQSVAPTAQAEVTARIDATWKGITTIAVQAAREQAEREIATHPAKIQKTQQSEVPPTKVDRARDEDDELANMLSDDDENETKDHRDDIETAVDIELGRYRAVSISRTDLKLNEALNYWQETGNHAFPVLRHVAQQVFGNQASAARIARDFSGVEQLLRGRRSRLDTYWVEMLMFLHLNFDIIPPYIPSIPSKEIRTFLPMWFNEADEELRAAENEIDPVEDDDDGDGLVEEYEEEAPQGDVSGQNGEADAA